MLLWVLFLLQLLIAVAHTVYVLCPELVYWCYSCLQLLLQLFASIFACIYITTAGAAAIQSIFAAAIAAVVYICY